MIVLPKVLPENLDVKARARTIDIAPTLLDLLGVETPARTTGRSLVPLTRGQVEEERVVVSEGRGSRAIMHGRWRLVVREGAARILVKDGKTEEKDVELYDLVDDPGERHDLASTKGDVVAEMKARLEAALKNTPVVGARASTAPTEPAPTLHLRFAGGERPRRVSGTIHVGDPTHPAKSFEVTPVEIGRDVEKVDGGRVEVAFRTNAAVAVGFDVMVDPSTTPITWELWLDEEPWPSQGIFGGPFGLLAPVLLHGITTDEARSVARATALPTIDARRDVGLFVARELRGETEPAGERSSEGAEEMARLLREWGYAHGSSPTK